MIGIFQPAYRSLKGTINVLCAYLNVFYFFEIIFGMISLNVLYGNRAASVIALVMSICLSVQIILIYFRNRYSRHVQLVFMELHAAYSLPLFINLFTGAMRYHTVDAGFIIGRFVITIIELMFIVVLTDEEVIAAFE
jgi:hypothetical protein